MTAPRTATNQLTGLQRVAVALGPVLLRVLYSTWRLREINAGGWRELRAEGRPFIFALWHGQLLPLVVQHRSQAFRDPSDQLAIAMLTDEYPDPLRTVLHYQRQ